MIAVEETSWRSTSHSLARFWYGLVFRSISSIIFYALLSEGSTLRPPIAPPQLQKRNSMNWGKDRWAQYLTKLAEETPGVSPELAEKAMNIDADLIPDEFVCPITNDLCMDPVVAVDGKSLPTSLCDFDNLPRTHICED